MPISNSERARIRTVSEDGSSTFPSRGVAILSISPPVWDSHLKSEEEDEFNNLNFNNIFVYNFYTLNERNRYNPDSNPWAFSPYKDGRGSLDNIRGLDGQEIQPEGDEPNRVTAGLVPCLIRLAWSVEDMNNSDVASFNEIEMFKKVVGIIPCGPDEFQSNELFRIPIRRNQGFEIMQRDYVAVSNEYLDMFSDLDLFRNSIRNPWFAEEIDSVHFKERMEFIYRNVVNDWGFHRNFMLRTIGKQGRTNNANERGFVQLFTDATRQPVDPRYQKHPYMQKDFALPPPNDPNSYPQVTDSALTENVDFPKVTNVPPEITLTLNSEYASDISRASFGSTGKILGTQTRIRNMFHQFEFDRTEINRSNEPGLMPVEQMMMDSIPYSVAIVDSVESDASITKLKLVGFVIEKTELREEIIDANQEVTEPISRKYPLIFVPCYRTQDEEFPNVPDRFVDAAINYGSKYSYNIRSVYCFTMYVASGDGILKFDYLVNSPFSSVLNIDAKETTPPPPPRDFSAFFDYTKASQIKPGELTLNWAFPVNKQRDTAYFAVFRRGSIYEPFNLLKILDFNFSIENRDNSVRNIKLNLVEPKYGQLQGSNFDVRDKVLRLNKDSSFNRYTDRDFELDKDYIYTVCALDAHGHISNYGTQILVNYDSKNTKLLVKEISSPGAPLIFPNWFIKAKAFQDVARVSRYRRAVVKFRPDYKKIYQESRGGNGYKLQNLVKTTRRENGGHPDNCYYLQIINPDRGKDLVIRYQIDDEFTAPDNSANLALIAKMLGISVENLRVRSE